MSEPECFQGSNGGRRRKRFLSPSEKYELWIGLLRGEYTMAQAAERAGVDRTTVMRVRQVPSRRYRSLAQKARTPRQLHRRGVGFPSDRPSGFGCTPPGFETASSGGASGAQAVSGGADCRRNSIWIYDVTRFHGCPGHAVFAVMDLVTRKWITELVSIEETSTQVQVAFLAALEIEGLLEVIEARQDAMPTDPSPFDAAVDRIRDPRTSGPSLRSSATNTRPSGCTPGSATSLQLTSIQAAAPASGPPADAGYDTPAGTE